MNSIESEMSAINSDLAKESVSDPATTLPSDSGKLDVCINVWGKPFQTAVAVNSLAALNADIIGKIYLIIEKTQPASFRLETMMEHITCVDRLVIHHPSFYLSPNELADLGRFKRDREYRHSIRYQYAIEESSSQWLLLIHNDVLFTSSLHPTLQHLQNQGEHLFGAGDVGQCWNCPLPPHCSGEKLSMNLAKNTLSPQSIKDLVNSQAQVRTYARRSAINFESPFPMPECRLNEWFAFLNLRVLKDISEQMYVPPFGAYTWNKAGSYTNDIGEDWFRCMIKSGCEFCHFDHSEFMVHGPFRGNPSIPAGHSSYLSRNLYDFEEASALEFLSSASSG
jgi:hypothetical protein